MIKLSEHEKFKDHTLFQGTDYTHYIPEDVVSLETAAALSLKMNPEKAKHFFSKERIRFEIEKNKESTECTMIRHLLNRAKEIEFAYQAGIFGKTTPPIHESKRVAYPPYISLALFVQWAVKKQYDIAEELATLCATLTPKEDWEALYHEKCKDLEQERQENTTLKTEIIQLKDQIRTSEENPSATTKKLDTKNKIIGALAKSGSQLLPAKAGRLDNACKAD